MTAVRAFTDGTQLTVRFGDLVPEAADDTDTGSTTTTPDGFYDFVASFFK